MSFLPQLSRTEYDALKHQNWSGLRLIEKSPAHYKLGWGDEETKSLKLGTAAHMAVLEPEKFEMNYLVYPARRQGKAWEAFEFDATAAGKAVLSQKEYDEAKRIRDAVHAKPSAMRYLTGGQAEASMVWELGSGDLTFPCKGRADYIGPLAIADLKSTRCASPYEFSRSCLKYGYFGQAAWYTDGFYLATGQRLPYVIIAVESSPPHIVTVFRVPDQLIDFGRNQYQTYLGKLHWCRQNNAWGGYTDAEEVDLELPKYLGHEAE